MSCGPTPPSPAVASAPVSPYAPGTVVEATAEVAGRIERRRFFRTRYLPNPWVAEQDIRDRAYYDDSDLSDVAVLWTPEPDASLSAPTAQQGTDTVGPE